MDPELVYLAGAYGGVLSGDPEELATGLWHAFRSSQVLILALRITIELS